MSIQEYLAEDEKRLQKLIEDHPWSLSPQEVGEFLHLDARSVRSVLESGLIGLSWRKDGSLNRGFYVSTAMFVRWYMLQQGYSNVCS